MAAVISYAPNRPRGTKGRQTFVTTNFFALRSFPRDNMYQYDVVIESVSPPGAQQRQGQITGVNRRRDVIKKMQEMNTPIFTPLGAYDGRATLISTHMYNFRESTVIQVNLSTGITPAGALRPPRMYNVSLTLVHVLYPRTLADWVATGNTAAPEGALHVLTALNIIVMQVPVHLYPSNARSFFTPDHPMRLGQGIELWRGFFQSVRPGIGRCLINIDTTTGAMWESGSLQLITLDFLNSTNARALVNMSPRDIYKLKAHLKNVRIVTIHRPEAPPRRIFNIDPRGARDYIVPGMGKTIEAYLRETYNVNLRFPDACCIKVSEDVAYPIELCRIAEKQLYKGRIPKVYMSKVLDFSKKTPSERLSGITNGLGHMQYTNSPHIRSAGMSVNTEPLRVPARILSPPTILYNNRRPVDVRDGKWDTRRTEFYKPVSFQSWTIVVTVSERQFSKDQARRYCQALAKAMEERGMRLQRREASIHYVDGHSVVQRLQHIFQAEKPDVYLIVTLPMDDIYYKTKHFGDISNGIVTQHVTVGKASSPNDQLCANIAMKSGFKHTFPSVLVLTRSQINSKMGGINHVPAGVGMEWLTNSKEVTMVFGADTTHPGPDEGEKPTISALVASMDDKVSQYFGTARAQQGRQEIIADLQEMVIDALKSFKGRWKANVSPPTRVLFYRDGVSEGELERVRAEEVEAVRGAFAKLGIPRMPKITFVVVGKRHHARFFPLERNDRDKSGNVVPGMVVDSDIVHPHNRDFYMQSQAGLLGTSRSMHVTVIVDENHMTPDELEGITFALTHNFERTTRSVSIPAPVKYADIVCGRAKIHFEGSRDIQWSETASMTSGNEPTLQQYQQAFKPLNPRHERLMYWL